MFSLKFKNIPTSLRSEVTEKWRHEMEPKLEVFFPKNRDAEGTLWITKNPESYEAHAVLRIRNETLFVQNEESDCLACLRGLTRKLRKRIRRHKERLREERFRLRKNRRESERLQAGEFLSESSSMSSEVFRELAISFLRDFEQHAARELRIAQLENRLPRGKYTFEDLRDEVIARAWETLKERTQDLPLDSWLLRITHNVLDEWIQKEEPVHSLEGDRVAVEESFEFEDEKVFSPMEEVVADPESYEPVSWLTIKDSQKELLEQLSNLPNEQRRAFTLVSMEGWDEVEAALLLGESPETVKLWVEQAKEYLKQHLPSPAAE